MTNRYLRVLVGIVGAALVVSGIAPYDRTTWWLEIFPILIGTPILVATYRRFPLTKLTYTLLAIHALILVVGGHYTYARVPLGFWAQNVLGLARNDYDRLGHFVQGFVPAILIREVLLRTSPLRPGRWLFVLVTATCLAFSACYEFFEWWSALAPKDTPPGAAVPEPHGEPHRRSRRDFPRKRAGRRAPPRRSD